MNIIETANLIFRYKIFSGEKEQALETTVLDGVSLSINKGDFVGILGHNGSGKSTLAKQLTALLKPNSGVVYVKGMDTARDENILPVRKTAGIVFQNPDNQLIGSTVEEDVAFGLENLGVPTEAMWIRIGQALEAAGMSAYRMSSPGALSGGQKQRVAIAGILAMEPECIIFDEPTAMLDPSGREEIMKAIRYLNRERGITIIYITHHTREVEDADYLYVMNQGKVVMAGVPSDLWGQTDQLKQYQIGLPFVQELIDQLRLKGMEIPSTIRDKDQLLDYIFRKSDGSSDQGEKKFDESSGHREKKSDECTGQDNKNRLCLSESENDLKNTNLSAGIRLDHLSYSYKSKNSAVSTPALKDISLTIRPGEYAAIVGQTGSGKSTLLAHLNGLLVPSEGKYYFNGEEVHSKGYPIRRLRQKVALCFQYPEYQLFEESVLKDIEFGPKNMGMSQEEADRKAREAMKLTGLSEDLETMSPFVLSGGQKRRVALAGILAMEPDYLILDEPAAGLDQEGKQRLFDLLDKLQSERNVTIILVSHDMEDVAAHARRVIVMKEGELLMDGPTEEIFAPEREDILKSAGLTMPEYLEFYYALHHISAGRIPLTIERLADYIKMESIGNDMADRGSLKEDNQSKQDNQKKQDLDGIDENEGEDSPCSEK